MVVVPPRCASCALLLALLLSACAEASHGEAGQPQQEGEAAPRPPVGGPPLPAHTSVHKPLLPIEVHDVALFLLSFLVLSLAAGAGIGGGVLLVPMLTLITGFTPIQTVALSNVTILAGALTNLAFNLPRKNPIKPGPLIDYDLLLLFGPPIVVGSIAGSLLNYFVPGFVTKTLMLLVLLPMTVRMLKKARMLWVAENRRYSGVLGAAASQDLALPPPPTALRCHGGSRASSTDPGKQARGDKDAAATDVPTIVANCSSAPQSPHPAPQLATAHSLPQLEPGLASAPSLLDTVGPYLVLLNTPEAAEATVFFTQTKNAASARCSLAGGSPRGGSWGGSVGGASPTCYSRAQTPPLPMCGCEPGTAAPTCATCGGPAMWRPSPFDLYQQQRSSQQQQAAPAPEGEKQQPPAAAALPAHARAKCRLLDHSLCFHAPELEATMRHKIQRHIAAQVPKRHLAALTLMLVSVIVTSICGQLLLTCGTWQYWLLVLSPMPLMGLVWAAMRRHVLWCVGWQCCLDLMHAADICWTPRSTLTSSLVVVSVGILAGLLGMGGGIVLAPLLLEMGVPPAVSASSSQAAMLISSCTSSVIYLVNHSAPPDYVYAMLLIGFLGTAFGQVAMNAIVARTGRSSILVFILAALFVLASAAGLVVLAQAVAALARDKSLLAATHAHEICSMRAAKPAAA